jgi:hypothetical protein
MFKILLRLLRIMSLSERGTKLVEENGQGKEASGGENALWLYKV